MQSKSQENDSTFWRIRLSTTEIRCLKKCIIHSLLKLWITFNIYAKAIVDVYDFEINLYKKCLLLARVIFLDGKNVWKLIIILKNM